MIYTLCMCLSRFEHLWATPGVAIITTLRAFLISIEQGFEH